MGKWAKYRVFLNLKKNLVINFQWICSIMKVFIICCVPQEMLYLGKMLFLGYRPNALSQSDCRIFKSTVSPEQIVETASFLACWYKFTKIKSWLKFFWLGMIKNGYGQSGLWTLIWLYLKNEPMQLTDFLHACTNSCKLKGDQKF